MTGPDPTLYVFAISHYCEKARWALDHFGIAYRLQHVVPGLNRVIAKRLGGPVDRCRSLLLLRASSPGPGPLSTGARTAAPLTGRAWPGSIPLRFWRLSAVSIKSPGCISAATIIRTPC